VTADPPASPPAPAPQAEPPAPPLDARPVELEVQIPKLLRAGLLAACLLLVIGLAWFALVRPGAIASFSLFALPALFATADPRALIGAGILVLLLTPLLRVLASLRFFLKEKDRLYAALTLLVILNLAAAIAVGAV